ncbi:MAG: NUDIX hydrolase [Nitrospiraceae bacterium]
MRFCPNCATPVEKKIPVGDNLPRFVCDACPAIHYDNPKIVAGCIPEWNGKLLLCRRAIEPRSGYWTFPAGFMELGESTEQAACRETYEEALARVTECRLYSVISMPRIGQVYVVFRANLVSPDFGPGSESTEVALFDRADIPWNDLAFTVIAAILRRYDRDAPDGRFPLYVDDV